ncbi:MAG TPA: hypothetical protein VK958_10535 [Methylophilus sp.]|uniref:hypothetical protein n=1 Tax=Methylophilus sp. TaxID=29541 RepID=UPI002BCB0EDB|nr:hypothetical protein [Methylophilus sp.]HSH87670.1 hypothetical protein [Methylophilus sp.]
MATDSKNLVEEIIDNAIDPSTHLENDHADGAVADSKDADSIKRANDHPLNIKPAPGAGKA